MIIKHIRLEGVLYDGESPLYTQTKNANQAANFLWKSIGKQARRAPPVMQLSIPELDCAYRHAMAVYGDLENYVGKTASHVRGVP